MAQNEVNVFLFQINFFVNSHHLMLYIYYDKRVCVCIYIYIYMNINGWLFDGF